jgi:hypothetical protein
VVLCSVRTAADFGTRAGTCGAAGFLTKESLTADALMAILLGPQPVRPVAPDGYGRSR